MDRLSQGFQFKIQEQLNIKDEEIAGLSELLVECKAKIVEYKDQIDILENKIAEKKREFQCIAKDKKLQKDLRYSHKISEHHRLICELQKKYDQEICDIQEDFEQKLNRFHMFSIEQMNDQDQSFESDFQTVRDEIAETQTKIENFQQKDDVINDTSSIQIKNDVIAHLQTVVKQKSIERQQMLTDCKEQISEYLSLINEMEKKHQVEVNTLKAQIEQSHKEYKEAIRNLKLERIEQLTQLNNQRKEAEYNFRMQSCQLSKKKTAFSNSYTFTTKKMDAMTQLAQQSSPLRIENYSLNGEFMGTKKRRYDLLESRKEKEMELNAIRNENFELQRQITLLRHSMKYSKGLYS